MLIRNEELINTLTRGTMLGDCKIWQKLFPKQPDKKIKMFWAVLVVFFSLCLPPLSGCSSGPSPAHEAIKDLEGKLEALKADVASVEDGPVFYKKLSNWRTFLSRIRWIEKSAADIGHTPLEGEREHDRLTALQEVIKTVKKRINDELAKLANELSLRISEKISVNLENIETLTSELKAVPELDADVEDFNPVFSKDSGFQVSGLDSYALFQDMRDGLITWERHLLDKALQVLQTRQNQIPSHYDWVFIGTEHPALEYLLEAGQLLDALETSYCTKDEGTKRYLRLSLLKSALSEQKQEYYLRQVGLQHKFYYRVLERVDLRTGELNGWRHVIENMKPPIEELLKHLDAVRGKMDALIVFRESGESSPSAMMGACKDMQDLRHEMSRYPARVIESRAANYRLLGQLKLLISSMKTGLDLGSVHNHAAELEKFLDISHQMMDMDEALEKKKKVASELVALSDKLDGLWLTLSCEARFEEEMEAQGKSGLYGDQVKQE